MVSARPRGTSIHVVMVVVTVMAFLAATMTAIYLMNLNFVQATSNGEVALNEAEAGVAELLIKLQEDETFGQGGGVELRGRSTSEFNDNEAYYLVTFNPASVFPYSVNNVAGAHPVGWNSRAVPGGSVHAVSTGYCRGQYRQVEVVIDKPPFPYALATSGTINSNQSIQVYGVSQAADYPDNVNRPGHVVANSTDGITIGSGAGETFISGFVKSVGPVTIEQPAVVEGGVRPLADETELPRVDFSRWENAGDLGVAEIYDSELNAVDGVHVLDVSYHCSSDLTLNGRVEMRNGFLWVDGNLTINGPLYGNGAIVVENGDLLLNGGVEQSTLAGLGEVALLVRGDVTMRGAGNFFKGILYAEGNLDLRNIGVLGAVIANGSDPTKGSVELEDVTLIAAPDTAGELSFVVTTAEEVEQVYDNGRIPTPVAADFNHGYLGQGPHGGSAGYYTADVIMEQWNNGGNPVADAFLEAVDMALDPASGLLIGDFPPGNPSDPQSVAIANQASELAGQIGDIQDLVAQLQAKQDELDGEDDPDRRDDLQAEIADLQQQITQAEADVREAALAFEQAYYEYVASHTGEGTSYWSDGNPGGSPMDIPITININDFLPLSDQIKVTFWQVTSGRP